MYIYRSEGFARTAYLIPGRDGEGVGPGWDVPSVALQGPQMGVFRYTHISIVFDYILYILMVWEHISTVGNHFPPRGIIFRRGKHCIYGYMDILLHQLPPQRSHP